MLILSLPYLFVFNITLLFVFSIYFPFSLSFLILAPSIINVPVQATSYSIFLQNFFKLNYFCLFVFLFSNICFYFLHLFSVFVCLTKYIRIKIRYLITIVCKIRTYIFNFLTFITFFPVYCFPFILFLDIALLKFSFLFYFFSLPPLSIIFIFIHEGNFIDIY